MTERYADRPEELAAQLRDPKNHHALLSALIEANGGPITIEYDCWKFRPQFDQVVVVLDPCTWAITIASGYDIMAKGKPLQRPDPRGGFTIK